MEAGGRGAGCRREGEGDAGSSPEEWRDAGLPWSGGTVGGGGCTFLPRGRKGGGTQVALEKEGSPSAPSPEKGEMEGGRAPEARTEGCVFPAKEERTEGYGERKARDASEGSLLGESCALTLNERRDTGPAPCPRCAVLAQGRGPEPRAGVAPFLLSSLPSLSSFPLCFLCLFIAIPPDLG